MIVHRGSDHIDTCSDATPKVVHWFNYVSERTNSNCEIRQIHEKPPRQALTSFEKAPPESTVGSITSPNQQT
jgi:hypothetical protein